MLRRRILGAGLAACVICCALAGGESVSDKTYSVKVVLRRANGAGTVIDTTDSGKIIAYPADEDTTGNGVTFTYSKADSFGYWYATSIATDVYDFYVCHSTGACTLLTGYADEFIQGAALGDTQITATTNFAANVIARGALGDDVIGAAELDDTAQFTADRFTANEVLADTIADKDGAGVSVTDPVWLKDADADSLTADLIAVDTLQAFGDSYLYFEAVKKIPAAYCVLDTFIHFSDDGAGTNCVTHKVLLTGAVVGEYCDTRPYSKGWPRSTNVASGNIFGFNSICEVTDSVTVYVTNSGVGDYYGDDSVLVICREFDWAGD